MEAGFRSMDVFLLLPLPWLYLYLCFFFLYNYRDVVYSLSGIPLISSILDSLFSACSFSIVSRCGSSLRNPPLFQHLLKDPFALFSYSSLSLPFFFSSLIFLHFFFYCFSFSSSFFFDRFFPVLLAFFPRGFFAHAQLLARFLPRRSRPHSGVLFHELFTFFSVLFRLLFLPLCSL